MEVYLIIASISAALTLGIVLAVLVCVCYIQSPGKLRKEMEDDSDFEAQPAMFLPEPPNSDDEFTPGMKLPSFRRFDSSIDGSESTTSSSTPPLSLYPANFTIPRAPSSTISDLSIEKAQPPISPRTPSMSRKLDPAQLDPTSHMYKEMSSPPQKISQDGSTLGIMNFSLKYNSEMGLLTVRLIQARNLQPRDFSGTADPYCKVCVIPHASKTLQSKVHRKTVLPEFRESFVFEIPEIEIHRQTVRVYLYDYDQFSRDECIGVVELPLAHVDLTEKLEVWKGIRAPPSVCTTLCPSHVLGDLMFSLSYLPSAERLTVVILKARNLRTVSTAEGKQTADPYVKVSIFYMSKRLKKKKTSTQHGTRSPVFNEALVFNVDTDFLQHLTIEFQVIHENRFGPNEVLGKAVVGPGTGGEELAHWNDMIRSGNKPVASWHCLLP
ncbi:synaptotagmin-5-like [Strongylocentrotus purpuratus]|uniref:C2 domain-containing protein n=1 Tax=Strongylocentrotus purpuratus TaxID=7668 RepID=A0A7M7PQ73_STRPU|nr:synaptotagmin-5-like [Strongylocentrotus purpuratus]|eukprot:XP_011666659.1 PREDICTED: synaptotagmin-5-like [Strongylocentrotus purpuratus]